MSEAIPLLQHAMTSLAPYLAEAGTEEICINRCGECWWRIRGEWTRLDLPELDYLTLEGIAILAVNGCKSACRRPCRRAAFH
jgi:type IV secretion system protein VirB11